LLFAGVGLGVSGSGVSVRVGGIAVGTVKPGLVGGKVDVTKRIGAFVGAFSCETVTQAVRINARRRKVEKLFLFIGLKYNANKKSHCSNGSGTTAKYLNWMQTIKNVLQK